MREKFFQKVLYAIFEGRIEIIQEIKQISEKQLNLLYNFLYKQKILQLSSEYLKQLVNNCKKNDSTILQRVDKYIEKTHKRNGMLQDELCLISTILKKNDIEHLSIKGPLFSEIYFDDIGKRICGDIDLLVKEDEIIKVKSILGNAGYIIEQHLFEQSLKHHYHFEARKRNVIFEIHWNIDYGKNNYWDYFFCNSYPLYIGEIDIRVLNDEAQFLLFMVSISKDWFTRAGASKYLDLTQIINRKNINYESVFNLIEQFGLSERCYGVLVCLKYYCKTLICPMPHVRFSTKVFIMFFLSKRKVILGKKPYKLIRKIGEKLIWRDTSFTCVPNIYKAREGLK